jgi:hypothetical protein
MVDREPWSQLKSRTCHDLEVWAARLTTATAEGNVAKVAMAVQVLEGCIGPVHIFAADNVTTALAKETAAATRELARVLQAAFDAPSSGQGSAIASLASGVAERCGRLLSRIETGGSVPAISDPR